MKRRAEACKSCTQRACGTIDDLPVRPFILSGQFVFKGTVTLLQIRFRPSLKGALLAASVLTCATAVSAWADSGSYVPTGQTITPSAVAGSTFTNMTVSIPALTNNPGGLVGPDGAIQSALNPADGKTLVVMTSGYNTYDLPNGSGRPAAYNGLYGPEYIFAFDTTNPTAPVRNKNPMGQSGTSPAAALTPQDTFQGMIWSPDGTKLYVSGGTDGNVIVYPFNLVSKIFGAPTKIQLIAGGANGDANGVAAGNYLGPQTSGLALDPTGRILIATNALNNSISVVDTGTNKIVVNGYDLRPYNTTPATGNGLAGGEEPYGVAITADGKRAYITSIRDREVLVLDISNALNGTVSLITRIPVTGSPNNVVLKASTGELFVAEDNSDQVAVIDTNPSSGTYNTITHTIDAIAPAGTFPATGPRFTGAATNNVALSPDGNTLYVTNGGANDVAIVPLAGAGAYQVAGLVPTGWYPTTVTPSADGSTLYIFNNKSNPGGNPLKKTSSVGNQTQTIYPPNTTKNKNNFALQYGGNQYVFQLEQSGFLTAPISAINANLPALTAQVAKNNGWSTVSTQPDPTMQFLQAHIQHVIYIVKENRTFDQVLGDLTNGANADPSLTVFGRVITPNFHRIASGFVTLDNFFDPGEVSGNGWPWSTSARETDWNEKNIAMDYTFGYGSKVTRSNAPYDAEGQNANVSVGYNAYTGGAYDPDGTVALRTLEGAGYTYSNTTTYSNSGKPLPGGAINLRPGPANPGIADGAYAFSGLPANSPYQSGYIWNAALNANKTVRNYGFFSDNSHYGLSSTDVGYSMPLENPETAGCTQILTGLPGGSAFGTQQEWTAAKDLIPYTDLCFRGFDNSYPDAWRFEEFRREFNGFVANGNLPNLVLLRYMHDHMGNFTTSGSGGGASASAETEQADNDYAVGATLQMLAHSPYAGNTLVFVVEDDAQDGPDHVDAHRSTAYVVGPYVKHNALIRTRYSTVNMIRTIEDVLGLQHVNLNTAYQKPMSDVFNPAQGPAWSYAATASPVLKSTTLNLSAIAPDGKVQFADGDYKPLHDAAWWAEQTKGFDFSSEDRIPADLFNRVIWEGVKGNVPYPAGRSGKDMSRPVQKVSMNAND